MKRKVRQFPLKRPFVPRPKRTSGKRGGSTPSIHNMLLRQVVHSIQQPFTTAQAMAGLIKLASKHPEVPPVAPGFAQVTLTVWADRGWINRLSGGRAAGGNNHRSHFRRTSLWSQSGAQVIHKANGNLINHLLLSCGVVPRGGL